MSPSVQIPTVQSGPSPVNITLSAHLSVSYVPLLCRVFGLGSMVPVGNRVMETRFVFHQLQKHSQKDIRAETFSANQQFAPAAVDLTFWLLKSQLPMLVDQTKGKQLEFF